MKNLRLLAWIAQLGLSVIVPLLGCILLSVWLRNHYSLGGWVVLAGIVLGIGGAVSGLFSSMKTMNQQANDTDDSEPKGPPTSFNDHT